MSNGAGGPPVGRPLWECPFRLQGPEDVDAEVRGWLAEAYRVGRQEHPRR